MNGRKLTVLTTIAGILAVGEFASSIMIWQENYPAACRWPPSCSVCSS